MDTSQKLSSCSESDIASATEKSTCSEDSLKMEMVDSEFNVDTDNNHMDRFLQRTRTDLMYELRNIQHGERPVTGQNHREHLQQFMEKHMVGLNDTTTTALGKGNNIPANVDTVEKHRPEAIVVEVQAIVELRPVSAALQSAAFRRQLERVILGSLPNRQPARTTSVNRPNSSQRTASSEIISNSGIRSLPIISEAIRPLEDRPQLVRQESTESVDSFSSARSSYEQDIDSDEEEVAERVTPHGRIPDSASTSPEGPVTTADSQMTNQQHPAPHVNNIWNEITTIQREEIVEEISELFHSRLVSSTLDGEFRTVLEMLAQNHLSTMGTNGRAVQDFINTLPRGGVQRNDFSQLGIVAGHEQDNWDNISVTSVSAHSVPYTQTNTHMGREIQGLKLQMNEMKNMIKLTVDLQMDIQRAIRQEVASAMNNFVAQGATGTSASVPKPSAPVSDTHCLICLERHTDTVLYQCGHMCVCFVCGRDLMTRGHKCPVCRAPIKDVIRAYKTNAE